MIARPAADLGNEITRIGGPDAARALYRKMVLIRRFDETALAARLDGRIYGTMHPYIGQEAIAVGVCSVLRRSDRITSYHRGHGHCIAKGADPERMMAELFGRVTGYCKGKGGSMHIADFDLGMLGANGIVGAGMPIATGSALAAKLTGSDDITVAFFGDGATGQGVFHESLNLSALWKLPIAWICENNMYSVDTRLNEALVVTDVYRLAAGYGIPAVAVDGNDLVAVAGAAAEAADRARRGQGPTFIEAKTYRWGVHSQRATPLPEKRPAEELNAWKARDPIPRFGDLLQRRGVMDEAMRAQVLKDVDLQIERAVAFAAASPWPAPDDALNDVWAVSL